MWIPLELLDNGWVKTLPHQWLHMQQYKNFWTFIFLCGSYGLEGKLGISSFQNLFFSVLFHVIYDYSPLRLWWWIWRTFLKSWFLTQFWHGRSPKKILEQLFAVKAEVLQKQLVSYLQIKTSSLLHILFPISLLKVDKLWLITRAVYLLQCSVWRTSFSQIPRS
jgi:hypothetical protein